MEHLMFETSGVSVGSELSRGSSNLLTSPLFSSLLFAVLQARLCTMHTSHIHTAEKHTSEEVQPPPNFMRDLGPEYGIYSDLRPLRYTVYGEL